MSKQQQNISIALRALGLFVPNPAALRGMRFKYGLLAEFFLIFGGLPLILLLEDQRGIRFTVLWLFAVYALWRLRAMPGLTIHQEWNASAVREGIGGVLFRAAPCFIALLLLTLYLQPARLFALPLERTGLWVMIMLLYPLLSVLPQELIYRSLFHHRYGALFSKPRAILLAAALTFGWGHIIFENWVAVLLCTFGGAMFSHTYLKHRSLALVVIEHSLYGCFIFTIGLGWYFYGGAAR